MRPNELIMPFQGKKVLNQLQSHPLGTDIAQNLLLAQNQQNIWQDILIMQQLFPQNPMNNAEFSSVKVPNFQAEKSFPNLELSNVPSDSKSVKEEYDKGEEFQKKSSNDQISRRPGVKITSDRDKAVALSLQRKIMDFSKFREIATKESRPLRRVWSEKEDQLLLQLIKQVGQDWALISKMMGNTRSGKQIRDRYLNNLSPEIKNDKWTEEEDELLLELYSQKGHKWCEISKSMDGRTETMVKNRFYSKFRNLLYSKNPKGESSGDGQVPLRLNQSIGANKAIRKQTLKSSKVDDASRTKALETPNQAVSTTKVPNPLLNAEIDKINTLFSQGNQLELVPNIQVRQPISSNHGEGLSSDRNALDLLDLNNTVNLLEFKNIFKTTAEEYLKNQQEKAAPSDPSKESSAKSLENIEEKLYDLEYLIKNTDLSDNWIRLLKDTVKKIQNKDNRVPRCARARGLEIIRAGVSNLQGLFTKTVQEVNKISDEINEFLKE